MGGLRRAAMLLLTLASAGAPACSRRGPARAASQASTETDAREAPGDLPAVTGFIAGPLVRDAAAVRRTYTRGTARVTVTLARFTMSASQYERWVETSTDGYEQATLDVAAGAGNGFYQCAERPRPSCDLLIQLRAGVHLELRGDGTSGRRDVDDLARGLPLRALATRATSPDGSGDSSATE